MASDCKAVARLLQDGTWMYLPRSLGGCIRYPETGEKIIRKPNIIRQVKHRTFKLGQWLSIPEMRDRLGCFVEPYTWGVDRKAIDRILGSCGSVSKTVHSAIGSAYHKRSPCLLLAPFGFMVREDEIIIDLYFAEGVTL